MSWQVFKNNVLRYADNPDSIQDIDTIAKVLATEYDAAIKRGGDTVNKIAVKQGNVDIMTQLFKSALQKGVSSSSPYDLVGELGNGVKAYWVGAILNNYPIPTIPAPGTTLNVSITSATVTNTGQWLPVVLVPSAPELTEQEMYAKLDFEKAGIDKNDPEVQQIIEPFNEEKFDAEVAELPQDEYYEETLPPEYSEAAIYQDAEIATSQVEEDMADAIDEALVEQKIMPEGPKEEDIKNGFSTLKELLKVADAWARNLQKNVKLKYENWIIGYDKEKHGLCAAGVKALVSAMLGIRGFGSMGGNANDYSFKSSAGESFAKSINGKKYYNDKIKINVPYTEVTNKKTKTTIKVPNYAATYIGDSAQWKIGDIVAFDYVSKPYGHIQIWTGWKWVSDHTQTRICALTKANPETIALWRYNDEGFKKFQEYSSKANAKNI
jgi:hypothetical protein